MREKISLLTVAAILVICAFAFVACSDVSNGKNSNQSPAESVAYTVTFVQDGKPDVVKRVKDGESLTDIPQPVSEKGYTIVWDRTDFSSVTENITVTTIKTPNVYTITYNLGINKNASLSEKTQSVTYGQPFTLPTPEYN